MYCDFALTLMERTAFLDFMVDHFCNYSADQAEFHGLPSWTPNWNQSGLARPLPKTASLDPGKVFFEVYSKSILQVQGLLVAYVKTAGDTFGYVPHSENAAPAHVFVDFFTEPYTTMRWGQWQMMARRLRQYPTGEPVEDAYIRTIVADSSPMDQLNSEHLSRMYAAWVKYWRIVAIEHGRYQEFYNALVPSEEAQLAATFMEARRAAAYGRWFLVTGNGYFGLGPSGIRRCDLIVALCGDRTLFALRGFHNRATLLGETYLHRIPKDILTAHRRACETFMLR